jgi:hypothetical protein
MAKKNGCCGRGDIDSYLGVNRIADKKMGFGEE